MWPAWMEGTAYLIILFSPLFIFAAVRLARLLSEEGRNPAGWVCLILLLPVISVLAAAHLRSPQYFWNNIAPPRIEAMQVFFEEHQTELAKIAEQVSAMGDFPSIDYDDGQFYADEDVPAELQRILSGMDIPPNRHVSISTYAICVSDSIDHEIIVELIYEFYRQEIPAASDAINDWSRTIELSGGWYLSIIRL